MPTTTTGTFFLGRQRPQAGMAATGDFALTLHALDRQGAHTVEPYLLTWTGIEARDWWHENAQRLSPGTPLHLVLRNPRSFQGLRSPVTHATVAQCSLAPLAPSWQKHAAPQPSTPATASTTEHTH